MCTTCTLPELNENIIIMIKKIHRAIGYYPARFPYKIPPRVLKYLRKNNVLDPFIGSGVVCTASRILNYKCGGFDINPFSILLSEVASSLLTSKDITYINKILKNIEKYNGPGWTPNWANIQYWYPQPVIDVLEKLWGYIKYNKEDIIPWKILIIALARTSRRFSYADPDIPKLYRGKKGKKFINSLLKEDKNQIKKLIINDFKNRVTRIINSLNELSKIIKNRQLFNIELRNLILEDVPSWAQDYDIILTSPPYLIAHEYIRSTKLELYWLGYDDTEIRKLKKMEIPYGSIPSYTINSKLFYKYRYLISNTSPHLIRFYDKYFWGVVNIFDKLIKTNINIISFFVGRATLGGIKIPIDLILLEHIKNQGYKCLCSYEDKIQIRKLFNNRNNSNPTGMISENLLILYAKN